MSEKKHIDRLFQEKFKNFDAKPSANVWAGIQSQMEQPQEKGKTILPFWLRFAGIAAALVLLFTVGNLVFNNENTQNNNTNVVDTNTPENENANTTSNSEDINPVSSKNTNKLEDNNNLRNENESLKNATVTSSENDSKNSSTYKTTQNKVTNLSSQPSNTKGASKENNVDTNRLVSNQNNNSNSSTNGISTNSENEESLNPPNSSQKFADSPVNNMNTTVSNSNNPDNTIAKNNGVTNSNNSNNSTIDNTNNTSNKTNTKATDTLDNNNATSNTAVAVINSEKKKEEGKQMDPDSANSSNSIEEALAKTEEDLDEKEEENVNRWSVNANAAPVYYNTLGKGSHIHDQFIDNPKNGEINTSYGVNVGYALNNKLKVRSGINKLNLSYDTANVIIYENVTNTPSSSPLRNINFIPTSEGQNISVLSANSFSIQQIDDFANDNLNAALSQRLSYIEVPLELEYTVVNNRFGVNIIGGFSTFILNDNEVVTEVANRKTKIGEANNINNVSFSANAGIGIDYKFNKSLKFNLEPTFKYQINAYNETSGDFRPYIIGVYTGFSYKF